MANSQIHKAATVFQRKAVGVTNEAFSGRVNSKENQVVAGCTTSACIAYL